MCFTGNSYLYGLFAVYLFQSAFVNVTNKSPVSSSYTFIHPSSFRILSTSEKAIPIFVVTFSILSLLESVFMKLSTTCAFPFSVSFITIPLAAPSVPVYAYHLT